MARSTDDELVQLLRPNEAVFGTGGGFVDADPDDDLPDDAFDDEPRPRWTVAVAGLLVTGLLAAGVIAAAPWNGDDTATPPTSTVPAATTTVATPRTTVPRDPLAGVITEPSGWVIGTGGFWKFGGAASFGSILVADPGRVDVWAAPDATRSGRWVSVESRPYVDGRLTADGVRTLFGDRPGVISTGSDDVTHVEVAVGERTLLVDSAGLALDEVTTLATKVLPPQESGGTMNSYGDLLTDDGLFGLPLRSTGAVSGFGVPVLDQPVARSYWFQDSGASISVDVWPVDEQTLSALPLVLAAVEVPPQLQATLDDLTAHGRDVSVFAPAQSAGETMVAWRDDDHLITLTGRGRTATLAQLLVSAGSARPADDTEWRDLLLRSQQGISTGTEEVQPTIMPSGEFTGSAVVWDAMLTTTFFFVNATPGNWYTPIGLELGEGAASSIQRYVAPDITVVVAVDPAGAATTMRVTIAGAAPVEVPMEAFGDGTAALHPWLENLAATVELLDDTGAVVLTAEV